jgi:hypothetical protein
MSDLGFVGLLLALGWAPPTSPQQIHPILVNFTAALLPLALLSDLLERISGRQSLHNAAWWIVLCGARFYKSGEPGRKHGVWEVSTGDVPLEKDISLVEIVVVSRCLKN